MIRPRLLSKRTYYYTPLEWVLERFAEAEETYNNCYETRIILQIIYWKNKCLRT